MSLDACVAVAVAVFAAWGYYSGAIQQISHVVGLAGAYVCGKPLAAALSPVLAERMGWPLSLTSVGVSAASMPVLLVGLTLIARFILNAVIPGDQRNGPDRVAGLFLGGAKAGVLIWAALSTVIAFEGPLSKVSAELPTKLKASSAAEYAREHGFFEAAAPTALDRLKELTALRDDPKLAEKLLADPSLKKLLDDPSLKKALEQGASADAMNDPRLKSLLENPELLKKLEELKDR